MRKLISKIFPIFVIVIVLLILFGLRSIDGDGTTPSYIFLGGRNPITCEKVNRGVEDRRYIYSFEADFNDVCFKAEAELRSEGFLGSTNFVGNDFSGRYYWQENKFPRGPVLIYIYRNCQYIENPDSKEGAFCEREGWVRVEIVHFRGWRRPF